MSVKIQIEVDDKGSVKVDQFAGKVKGAGNTTEQAGKRMNATWQKVERGIGSMHNRIKRFATGLPALLGFAGFVGGGTKILGMATAQEDVFRKLQTAVELAGGSWEASKPKIDSYLGSMQAITRYGDTDIAPSMTTILQLTGSVQKGFEGSKIAADIASTGLFNLDTASRYVAMAMEGNVEMLGRYVPQLRASAGLIDKNMSATEKWAIAKDLLNQKFGGSAEKDLDTYRGSLDSLKNYLGDVAEKAGDLIAKNLGPKIREWRDAVKEFIESGKLDEWAEGAAESVDKAFTALSDFGKWITEHGDLIKTLATGFVIFGAAVETANLAVNIGKITAAIKLLNKTAAAGFVGKIISKVGVAGLLEFAGALAVIFATVKAVDEVQKDWNESLHASKTQWDATLNTWTRVNEAGQVYMVYDKLGETWKQLSDVMAANTLEVDEFGNSAEDAAAAVLKIGDAADDSGKKIKGAFDVDISTNFSGLPKMEPPEASGNIRGQFRADTSLLPKIEPPELFGEDWWAEQTAFIGDLDVTAFQDKMSEIRQLWVSEGAPDPAAFEDNFNFLGEEWALTWEQNHQVALGVADATMQAFSAAASTITSEFSVGWDKVFGEANSTFEKVIKSMVTSFVSAIVQMMMRALALKLLMMTIPGFGQFSMIMGAAGLFHGGGLVMHQGGPVWAGPRLHDGLAPDEFPAILQRGEYVTPKRSVNAETLPVLQSIRETGRALPPGGTGGTSVSIAGDTINISGGGMDQGTVDLVRRTVQSSRESLAAEIEDLLEGRKLRMEE